MLMVRIVILKNCQESKQLFFFLRDDVIWCNKRAGPPSVSQSDAGAQAPLVAKIPAFFVQAPTSADAFLAKRRKLDFIKSSYRS